jgi:hypothetical protein
MLRPGAVLQRDERALPKLSFGPLSLQLTASLSAFLAQIRCRSEPGEDCDRSADQQSKCAKCDSGFPHCAAKHDARLHCQQTDRSRSKEYERRTPRQHPMNPASRPNRNRTVSLRQACAIGRDVCELRGAPVASTTIDANSHQKRRQCSKGRTIDSLIYCLSFAE